jgi:hypothetical protein
MQDVENCRKAHRALGVFYSSWRLEHKLGHAAHRSFWFHQQEQTDYRTISCVNRQNRPNTKTRKEVDSNLEATGHERSTLHRMTPQLELRKCPTPTAADTNVTTFPALKAEAVSTETFSVTVLIPTPIR